MKTVLILLDSLNRRFLNAYGGKETAITPNIDRLASRGVVFENHFCGSAPCMPARRDLMTGRLNFMERMWGGIEPYDDVLCKALATKNVYSRIETDHIHYAEIGGTGYYQSFTSWQVHRGAESDKFFWKPTKDGINKDIPKDSHGRSLMHYAETRAHYNDNPDNYSTPRTLTAAAEWLEDNKDADNFLLWAEGFDPHEPFDVPKKYVDMYETEENSDLPYWPTYAEADTYTEKEVKHFRALYKALVTMSDEYVGKILDVLDKNDMWKDTTVILTTDHGFMLGEHNYLSKNYMPDFNEVFNIPLIICAPEIPAGRSRALTQNIDVFPTILETFGVSKSVCRNKLHGKSLYPLLRREKESVRDELIFGTYGRTVNMYDGRYVYMRKFHGEKNEPLYLYGSDMSTLRDYLAFDVMSDAEIEEIQTGRFLTWTRYPVYKIPANNIHLHNPSLCLEHINDRVPSDMLFDLENDYEELNPLCDETLEAECVKKLKRCMAAHDAPIEQFERLGLDL